MADNVIDTLSIEINSSSKGVGQSVDAVIKHLEKLSNGLLLISSNSSGLTKGMATLTSGLDSLSKSISGLDSSKLKDVAKSIDALASSAGKLNNAFGNTGLDKATRDAQAMDAEIDRLVKNMLSISMVSENVSDEVSSLFKQFSGGIKWDNGFVNDLSKTGNKAFDDIIKTMSQNVLRKAQDEIDYTTKKIADYAGKSSSKVNIPFKIGELDSIGSELGRTPKQLLTEMFGVGGWTTKNNGNQSLKDYINGFNGSTGATVGADDTVQAFENLARVVIRAKDSVKEFNEATIEMQVDELQVWDQLVQMASAVDQFKSSLGSATEETRSNPFEQLANGIRQLEGINIPDLTGLANVAENIGKLSGKRAMAGIQNLPQLVQGLQGLRGLNGMTFKMDLTGLAKLIETLSALGYTKANSATANLQPIITGLTQLSALTGIPFPDPVPITALANAISTMGRQSTATAIQNMPQLATAFKNLVSELSTAPKLSNSTIRLAEALAKLSSNGAKAGAASRSLQGSLKSLQGTASPLTGTFKKLGTGVLNFCKRLLESVRHTDTASSKYNTLASKVGLLYAKYWALMRIVGIFNKITGAASSLIEVQNVVDTTFGKMSYKIEDFAKNAIKNFGLSELSAKQYASQFQAMGTAMGITGQQVAKAQQFLNTKKTMQGVVAGYDAASKSMADMSINLTKLAADLGSFFDTDPGEMAKKLQSGIFGGQSRALRSLGVDLTQATVQEWALNHGMEANFKTMTQAQKTMLRYQFVMSSLTKAQGDFQKTQNTWHNQLVILKQQLQQLAVVIGSGLIQAIKPFVMQMNSALSAIIQFAQNVVNALGKIFGWEMDINTKGLTIDDDALEDVEDLAQGLDDAGDSADSTSKSVKKLKDQLQGFDKLNVLRTTEKNPSSKKKKTDDDAIGGLGDLANADDVSAGLKKTKGLFESNIDNLFDLGRYISDTLAKQLEGINWNKVYEKARNFGTGLASFLNGLITPRLFADVGRSVASSINTAFEFLNSFGQTFDWGNFGTSIGAGIGAFLHGFNWGVILSAAKEWGVGLATTINEAVKSTPWTAVGRTLAMQLKTALTFLYHFADTLDWNAIGNAIADAVNGFIENFPAAKFARTINKWVQGIYDLVVTAVTNIKWNKLADKIAEFIGNLDFKTIAIVIGSIALKKGVGFAVSIGAGIISAIGTKIATALSTFLSTSLSTILSGIAGVASSLAPIVFAIGGVVLAAKGLFDIWTKGWTGARQLMVTFGTSVALAIGVVAGVLTGPLALAIAGAVAGLSFLAANHETIFNGIKEKWNEFKTSVASIGRDFVNIPGDFKRGVLDPLGSDISGLVGNATTMFGEIGTKFKDLATSVIGNGQTLSAKLIESAKSSETNAGGAFRALVATAKTKFQEMGIDVPSIVDGLKSKLFNAWGSIKSTAETRISQIKDSAVTRFTNMKNSIENAFKGVGSCVDNIWKDVFNKTKNKLGEIRSKVVEKFNGLIKELKGIFPLALGKLFQFKLPSFEFDTKTLQLANLSITYPSGVRAKWNKKAYDNPLMFTKPTVIPTMAGFQGFGDGNGGEMVYGHENLMNDIREATGTGEMTAIGNRQLANDQRIIQLLTAIASKEFGISSDTLFRNVRDQASNYTMRTGKQAFEF